MYGNLGLERIHAGKIYRVGTQLFSHHSQCLVWADIAHLTGKSFRLQAGRQLLSVADADRVA